MPNVKSRWFCRLQDKTWMFNGDKAQSLKLVANCHLIWIAFTYLGANISQGKRKIIFKSKSAFKWGYEFVSRRVSIFRFIWSCRENGWKRKSPGHKNLFFFHKQLDFLPVFYPYFRDATVVEQFCPFFQEIPSVSYAYVMGHYAAFLEWGY